MKMRTQPTYATNNQDINKHNTLKPITIYPQLYGYTGVTNKPKKTA